MGSPWERLRRGSNGIRAAARCIAPDARHGTICLSLTGVSCTIPSTLRIRNIRGTEKPCGLDTGPTAYRSRRARNDRGMPWFEKEDIHYGVAEFHCFQC